MPTYTFKCQSCTHQFDKVLPVSDYKQPQICPECGQSPTQRVLGPVDFVLRGDGWTGKNIRIKNQMSRRRKKLEGKENELKRDGYGMTLAPNVDGERVDSWAEAQKLAKSKGKDTSSYEANVRKERKEKRA